MPCEELVAAVEDEGAISVGSMLAGGGVAIAEGEARSSLSLVSIGGFSSSDMILEKSLLISGAQRQIIALYVEQEEDGVSLDIDLRCLTSFFLI